ncbi:very-long-chain 3-oxoacyl-CoA reductase-B-like [Pollicipes pollicipes]|uniref:very-long-chain 3-oxoacyl-CoA reductase-B-like n=1 Tax=Pollicipes pollicipes TaxID=41117 RepID=UPI00188558BF|nr:very-long-chain 3-oxoacyl-CoA reductase-B-like [Pollicipes pollicipes]
MGFIDMLGYATAIYLAIRLGLTLFRFVYTSFLGDMLGHTPDYKKLGDWAVITGATDGIGKAYAFEFARRGLNVLLISRTMAKLEQTAKEIEAKHGVQTRAVSMDFTRDLSAYEPIRTALGSLDVAVLVNNVGMNYEHPEFFVEIPDDRFTQDILNCNALSMTAMTRLVLPHMLAKKKGVIINLSSFSAVMPTALLTQYSATKAYVSQLSSGLQTEVREHGVIVQSTTPAFICSKMSKFTTPRLFVPSADQFVRAQLKTVGLETETFGCMSHKIQGMAAGLANRHLPESVMSKYYFDRMLGVRARAIKRKARKQE